MKAISCLFAVLLLSSCAASLNEPMTSINLYASKPTNVTLGNKSFDVMKKKTIHVKRGKDSLIFIAKQDTITRKIVLKPKNSFVYYTNVFSYGLGFIWDSKSEKRYTYQKNVSLDLNAPEMHRFPTHKKGEWDLIFSLPYINHFTLKPSFESRKTNAGFWGVTGGLEYFYKNNKSIGLSISAVSDFFLPVPAAVDLSGEHEFMSSGYISLTDNFKINDFSLGYGLNYSRNNWELRYYDQFDPPAPTRDPIFKSTQSLGFTFNSYYRLGKHFNIGIVYRPTFMQIKPSTKCVYEHLISIDLGWRWNLNK